MDTPNTNQQALRLASAPKKDRAAAAKTIKATIDRCMKALIADLEHKAAELKQGLKR